MIMDRKVDIENMGMDNQKITMTKKHYVMIAEAIKRTHEGLMYAPVNPAERFLAVEMITKAICSKFVSDNPLNFKADLFMKACGF